ncbi:MAG: hypothetical protein IJH75_07355 [Mogibacterium sp.]|nr:hypothetical protein [Mogibacterium sp.]
MESTYKVRSWRHTLDQLTRETGIGLKQVCEYIQAAYNEDGVSFYVKIPRRRSVFIGIGMAFRQPLEVINGWITCYGNKKKLYIKDQSEDLVWIYLIEANLRDTSGKNYFRAYEEYQAAANAAFRERWDEIILSREATADVEISLGQAEFGEEYEGLKAFVAEHIDAFKTAYARARKYLDGYLDLILEGGTAVDGREALTSINSLRGYLDDSMINYLAGDSETIHVLDRRTGKRTIRIKHVPKGKRQHISLCLALGMTAEELDEYLELMGYAPLDISDRDEGLLLTELKDWERRHPLQGAYKQQFFGKDPSVLLTESEKREAVEEMLQLRADLTEAYHARGLNMPYINRQ